MARSLSFLITVQIITISNLGRGKRKIKKGDAFPWQPQPGKTMPNVLAMTTSLALSREPASPLTRVRTACPLARSLACCWGLRFPQKEGILPPDSL